MNIPKITKLLKYRRPAWSTTEAEFIHKYIDTIPGVYADKFGNRLLVSEGSKTIISVHTDTVHWAPGLQQVQTIGDVVSLHPNETEKTEKVKENKTGMRPRHPWIKGGHKHGRRKSGEFGLSVSQPYGSNCLGADDTAGVYAALRMIDAGVKATFIFHRAEEIGGQGSKWLAAKYPKWIGSFDRCIALDRRGTKDVITSQWGSRCCSDAFGFALAGALGMGHGLAAGVFTDSANYAYLIPECSNLSVGYQHEHSNLETLDVNYLERLITRLVKVDWESLPTTRDWVADAAAEKTAELAELNRMWDLDWDRKKGGLLDQYGAIQEQDYLSELRKDIRFDSELDLDSGNWEDQ